MEMRMHAVRVRVCRYVSMRVGKYPCSFPNRIEKHREQKKNAPLTLAYIEMHRSVDDGGGGGGGGEKRPAAPNDVPSAICLGRDAAAVVAVTVLVVRCLLVLWCLCLHNMCVCACFAHKHQRRACAAVHRFG